ncbi:MAG TPA: hypothetical protein VKH41_07275, partial [Myxococcota bacterium]|nr:hypothetical protein [Myxococcota bacterium]
MSFRSRGFPRAALWIGATIVFSTTSAARAAEPETETDRLKRELDETKRQLSDTQQKLDELS